MKVALLKNGVVENIIIVESLEQAHELFPEFEVNADLEGLEIAPSILPIEAEVEPDWLTFRLTIFQDLAYQTVTLAASDAARSRFESEIIASDTFLQILPTLWGQLLQSAPEAARPTDADYQRWSGVADSCHVGFRWADDGALEVVS